MLSEMLDMPHYGKDVGSIARVLLQCKEYRIVNKSSHASIIIWTTLLKFSYWKLIAKNFYWNFLLKLFRKHVCLKVSHSLSFSSLFPKCLLTFQLEFVDLEFNYRYLSTRESWVFISVCLVPKSTWCLGCLELVFWVVCNMVCICILSILDLLNITDYSMGCTTLFSNLSPCIRFCVFNGVCFKG